MPDQKPIIIGNWKMKLGVPESLDLAREIKKGATAKSEIVVCPSFVSLSEVVKLLRHTEVAVGAQDCFWESFGAYTGEVSATYLKEVGCDFVIVGHSERRKYLGETDEMVHKKVKMALSAGLIPIVCVGETYEQRQDGSQDYVLIQQITQALEGIEIEDYKRIIIAYEPVWVVGSGQAIEPWHAEMAQQIIYQTLIDIFPSNIVSGSFQIIYGGSVDPNNAASFMELEHNQGFLVGTASLNASEFLAIIKNL